MTALAALIQAARDDLEDVRSRLDDLYADLDAREWQPGSGRSASGHRSRVLFDPTQLPVRQAWDDVRNEIARADILLRDHTDVPASPLMTVTVTERTPLADLQRMEIDCLLVDGMLAWCQRQELEDGEAAVREACEHVMAARARIRDLWPDRPDPVRCKRRGCEGGDGKPRPVRDPAKHGAVCDACRMAAYRARKAG